ncbi:MAG: YbaB/EbfC family nucleoid-associated protein [Spirochaetia bacterium]
MMNLMDMLNPENIKKMQATLGEAEEKLRTIQVTGEAGGGIVKVTLNGQYECVGIFLDPIAVDPRDINMLQTLIQSAYFAAWSKVKKEVPQASLGSLMQDLPDFLKKMLP